MKHPSERSATLPPRYDGRRWYVLAVLCLMYTLSIADRYAMSTVIEPVRLELHLSDSGVAFLTGTALALFYVVFGIPIAWLADRFSRRNVIAISIFLWSLMTSWSGFSSGYGQLLASRLGVGVGEGGATPAASSLLSDYFDVAERPMALTLFSLGAPLGAWLAAAVGGTLAELWSWRTMFVFLGIPGVLLSLLTMATVREPRRGRLDLSEDSLTSEASTRTERPEAATVLQTWAYLVGRRTTVHLLTGVALTTLWGWGIMWWMPAFLMRDYGVSVGAVGSLLGYMHLFGGVAATLGTAWLMGLPRLSGSRCICLLLGGLMMFGAGISGLLLTSHSLRLVSALLWVFVPAIYLYIGPTMGLLNNFVPPGMRALALATSLFVANVCNLVIAPQLVGVLSDWYGGGTADSSSLRAALLWLVPIAAWAAVHFWLSARALCSSTTSGKRWH